MGHLYRAYGLTCLSDAPIQGFHSELTASQIPDIHIELGPQPPPWVLAARQLPMHHIYSKAASLNGADSACAIKVSGREQYFELAYTDGTRFIIDEDHKRLWGSCPPGLPQDYLETYLRGPVMGFILRRRNVTALHASAIQLHDRAIVFCGESESGKSTTAAAFALKGTPVLCDDIVAVERLGTEFFVHPGYPHIGLWPDAVENLLGAADALPRWTQSWPKCFLSLDGNRGRFELRSLPVGAIYILAARTDVVDATRINEIAQREALIELVQNTYMNWILESEQRAVEFDFLSSVVNRVSVRRIVPPSDPAEIGALCQLVVEDVGRLIARPTVTSVDFS